MPTGYNQRAEKTAGQALWMDCRVTPLRGWPGNDAGVDLSGRHARA